MNVLFTSYKGGVGKTSIAYNFAIYSGKRYLTNDLVTMDDPAIIRAEPNRKRLPKALCFESDTVFDFGAMSTNLDPKIAQAVKLADVIVIPTLTDQRSISATLDTVNLLWEAGKPTVVIINNYKEERKYDAALKQLANRSGITAIYGIRSTTLFERVSRDGREWLDNIHNDHAEFQLQKTQMKHEQIYEKIISHGARA